MAANSSSAVINSLLEKLRPDDPWLPSRSWDSVPSSAPLPSNPAPSLYSTTSVSEPSLVRLAMNALQGAETALLSISELSALFRYSSTDRTSHRIPSLWTRCSSTSSMGDLFSSIGQFGCVVFLLRMFINYFSNPDFEDSKIDSPESGECPELNFSLINQAFAISVQKVIDGYVSALDTLSTSVSLRRCSKTNNKGFLSSIGHSETTLLEVYLHTTGLRAQIEALGNVCNVTYLSFSFHVLSLGDLKSKAYTEFSAFPRGGALLSFLYDQLKVANADHCSLLKFLFLQSYEPYCGFIRSWIYDGRLTDPYNEFVVEYVNELSILSSTDGAITPDLPLPTITVRDGVPVPCFLEECLVPICRTGQQLQVIMKLLELSSSDVGTYDIHKEILPSSVDLSTKYTWFAFPLTFNKEIIETMSSERAMYYQRMLEDTDNIITKFDFSSREAVSHSDTLRLVNYIGKNLIQQASSIDDESLVPLPTDKRNQYMVDNTINSEASSITDDCSCDEDLVESSECSFSESSEEQNTGEQFNSAPHSTELNLLSALDFSNSSLDNIKEKVHQSELSCSVEYTPFTINEMSGHPAHRSFYERLSAGRELALSSTAETQVTSSMDDQWAIDWHSKKDEVTWLPKDVRPLELMHTDSNSMDNISIKDLDMHGTDTSSDLSTSHPWMQKYDSTIFCMNPMQSRDSLWDPRTFPVDAYRASYGDSHFDFTSVKDPLKSAGSSRPLSAVEHSVKTETVAPGVDTGNQIDREGCSDVTTENNICSSVVPSPLHEKGTKEDISLLPSTFGGSTWESLLSRSSRVSCRSISDHRTRLLAAVEMPLDFVIRKCLLDEIILQYKYLSKLAIKLLTEGFSLQKHLLALRCYHFMELADWADLFIMSLWNRKWHVNEVDKRIPEIQGALELSAQRSSCEGDPYKDRLFVFLKGDNTFNPSAPATGIHSFDFLGLGYRVDWPVNIVLTPAALNIYSEIFNFLIQVKLAVFSLSDAWCSLKSYCSDLLKGEVNQAAILTETRHKLNHFVSTLQQYVHSQLSHVSWCRFQDSLKNKVSDMLDLESVHMAYLTESLQICFLSDEARSVAGIIQNILECAMDFRSCLTGGIQYGGFKDEKPIKEISRLGISQVHAIRRTLNQNLEELHLIYLRSAKHGEFSISRFWDCLNYNEYYGGVFSSQTNHSIFYP